MSLKVWLPLNGNLNNQGCSPLKPVQMSVTPTYVNGKIGQALSTGDFYLPGAEVAKFYNNNGMSWAFWIYPTTSGSVATPIIGQSNTAAGACRMFTIFQYPNGTDLHLSWQNETGGDAFLASILTNAFVVNTWNHCAITYNGSTVTVYINGIVRETYTNHISARTNFNYDVPIPNASCRYLNDLRIYDHCLSPKEVKEISKGLVIHYPLDNVMESGLRNLYPSIPYTPYNDEGYYKWVVDHIGAGSHSWPSISFGAIDTTGLFNGNNPTTLLFYIKYRVNNAENMGIYIRCARDNNDWACPSADWVTYTDGKWHECVQIVDMYATSQLPYNESPTPTSPRIECGFQDLYDSGVHYYIDVDIKDVMICPIDHYIPYINNNMISNKIIDTSGFGYHGSRNGTFNISSDTPRYSIATHFTNANSTYITIPAMTLDLTKVSISAWFRINSAQVWQRIFDLGEKTEGTGYSLLLAFNNDGKTLTVAGRGANGASLPDTTIQAISLNTWYHVVTTIDGTICKTYVNGILVKTFTLNQAFSTATPMNLNYLGKSNWSSDKYLDGDLCDYRLYTTVLSADDVKELYESSASIANNGAVFGYDFNEE